MADIDIAIAITIRNEGGFVDNPNDPGGRTKYGITQRDLDITAPGTEVETITPAFAANWYKTTTHPQRYNNPLYGQIEDQVVANKIFDLGVLFGVGTAVQLMQGILKLVVDGNFGPQSLAAVNESDPHSLLVAYKTVFVQHAINIGAAKPSERLFVVGWIRRINS